MKRFMILPILAMTILAFGISHARADEATPKLIALSFYADWCGNCKVLDPEFDKAMEQGGWSPSEVKVITFDLTDKVRIGKTVAMSKEQGVYEALKANGAKTGSIAILDGTKKEELTRFYAGDSAEKIQTTIAEKLAL